MSKCEHGRDFAEYTYCSLCDYDEIRELREELDALKEDYDLQCQCRDAYRQERDVYETALLSIIKDGDFTAPEWMKEIAKKVLKNGDL